MPLFDQIKNNKVESKFPICNETIKFSYSQLGTAIKCPHCKNNINLEDNGLKAGLNKIDKQLKKLSK